MTFFSNGGLLQRLFAVVGDFCSDFFAVMGTFAAIFYSGGGLLQCLLQLLGKLGEMGKNVARVKLSIGMLDISM